MEKYRALTRLGDDRQTQFSYDEIVHSSHAQTARRALCPSHFRTVFQVTFQTASRAPSRRNWIAVRTPSGEIELPAAAQRAVEQLLAELASGSSVHVLADDHELTTAQAGELLGLSRTFVVRLIDHGILPGHYAGTHRRIRTSDVLAYARQRQQRLDAVAAIAHGDVAIGIPYR